MSAETRKDGGEYMIVSNDAETKRMSKANAISVLGKLLTGSIVIMLVGVFAYFFLVFVMTMI